MGVPKKIRINNGSYKPQKYYYWSEYESWNEAKIYANKLKEEYRNGGIKLKYFILESDDSWFLPVPIFALYFNKKLQ